MKIDGRHVLSVYFLVILFLISFASADLGTFKQFDCVNLRTISNSTAVNLSSISLPNSTTFYPDAVMTKNGKTFTFQYCNTTLIGTYIYDFYDVEGNDFVNSFNITASGFAGTLGFYFLILILSLGIIVLGFYMSDAPITIIGSFGLYFVGLYILFNGIDAIKDAVYTWALGLLILSLAAYISIRSTYELIVD